ncbi:hypothetical protein JCM14469_12850 [Desulfatiferula olefinivorans]
MNDLRETPRIDAGQMIVIRPEGSLSGPPVQAMVLNMSLDGALIETRDPVSWDAMALTNEYKHQRMTVRAKVVHQDDFSGGAFLFGPHRTGLRFLDGHDMTREFIFSVVKCMEKAAGGFQADGSDLPSDWMDTNQINAELFSLDAPDDEEMPAPSREAVRAPTIREQKPEAPAPVADAPAPAAVQHRQAIRPVETRPRPAEPKRRRFPTIPVFLGLALLVLGASLMVFRHPAPQTSSEPTWMERLGLDLPFVTHRSPSSETPPAAPPPAALVRETISGTAVTGDSLGTMFVIRGMLTIRKAYPPEGIRIRAALLDASRKPVADVEVMPGHRADDRQVARFGKGDLDRIAQVLPEVRTGDPVPFLVIFPNVSGSIESYTVELTFKDP